MMYLIPGLICCAIIIFPDIQGEFYKQFTVENVSYHAHGSPLNKKPIVASFSAICYTKPSKDISFQKNTTRKMNESELYSRIRGLLCSTKSKIRKEAAKKDHPDSSLSTVNELLEMPI